MANDDLFSDAEHGMVRMTFGEHLEDLRRRLVLAIVGFVPGLIIGLCIGFQILNVMRRPAHDALVKYYARHFEKKAQLLREARDKGMELQTKPLVLRFTRSELREMIREAAPELRIPPPPIPVAANDSDATNATAAGADSSNDEAECVDLNARVSAAELQVAMGADLLAQLGIISLGPMETFFAYMKVSLVAGLVISSWWIIYQLWMFVAEGLYRNERRVVYRAAPLSVALFLAGVTFCFFVVLPVVLTFCFSFNEWFDIPPTMRLSEWLSFATLLPLVFGICFELPLVMLVLEAVGIFTIDVYISKWRHAILVIAVVAMVVTPTTDPGSMMLLMGPMAGLYFLGIGLVQMRRGGLRGLSPIARLRAVAGIFVALYLIGISVGFVFPAGWLPDGWWLDQVWRLGTLPISWALRSKLDAPSPNWLWVVTLANAAIVGLVVLRLGELLLRMMRRSPGTTIAPTESS